ncbi:MAG: hypothetical protein HY297_02405 [Thaumarchaeota archaeon]|nr:hypothetical protein [Nitrososphaerota archaeon]
MKTQYTAHRNHNNMQALKLGLVATALILTGTGLLPLAAAAPSFNNLQIFISTSGNLPYSYTVTAYNLTGAQVVSYQTQFPAAAFELPTGDYMFTVSAVFEQGYGCAECLYASASTVTTSNGADASQSIRYVQPQSEYGYLIQHVDSSASYTIRTQNVTQLPTAQVTIRASYVNGTAASGAYVSASIVGQWYYWWGQDAKTLLYAQTGKDGVANLVLPQAPAVVTAWMWVPVDLPSSQTTVTKNVGGEVINVTVYWQPTYVGLSASALVIPPAHEANLTLRYQQPSYWAMPLGARVATASSGEATGATVSNQTAGVPSLVNQASVPQSAQTIFYLPSKIPSLDGSSQQAQSLEASSPTTMPAILASAALFGALAVAAVVLRLKHRPPAAPA